MTLTIPFLTRASIPLTRGIRLSTKCNVNWKAAIALNKSFKNFAILLERTNQLSKCIGLNCYSKLLRSPSREELSRYHLQEVLNCQEPFNFCHSVYLCSRERLIPIGNPNRKSNCTSLATLEYPPIVLPHVVPRIVFRGLEFVAQGPYDILEREPSLGDKQLKVWCEQGKLYRTAYPIPDILVPRALGRPISLLDSVFLKPERVFFLDIVELSRSGGSGARSLLCFQPLVCIPHYQRGVPFDIQLLDYLINR